VSSLFIDRSRRGRDRKVVGVTSTSDLKDESKYEDIDDLRTDKQGYLEYATDSISVVQSGNSLPSSDGYIVPTPEYLDLEEKSSDIPTETLFQNE
jgi:hypothetical protein